jgi:hypothetical protein
MEYLVTYGWAIAILGVVIAALIALGILNPTAFTPNVCSFPADFGCLSVAILPPGNVVVNIEQSTASPITLTAVGCNDAGNTANMITQSPPTGVYMQIGSNYTVYNIRCYANGVPFNGVIGRVYTGWIVMNYTDSQSGFKHVVAGRLIQKVT